MLESINKLRDFIILQKNRLGAFVTAYFQEWQKTEYKYPSFLGLAVGVSLYATGFGVIPLLWMTVGSFLAGYGGVKVGRELLALYADIKGIIAQAKGIVEEINSPVVVQENEAEPLSGIQALKSELNKTIVEARETMAQLNAPIAPPVEGEAPLGGVHALKFQLNQTIEEVKTVVAQLNAPVLEEIEEGEIVNGIQALMFQLKQTIAEAKGTITQINTPIAIQVEGGAPLGGIQSLKSQLKDTITRLDGMLKEVTVTTQNLNSAAQTASTYSAPVTYLAKGFRAVGSVFSSNVSNLDTDDYEENDHHHISLG